MKPYPNDQAERDGSPTGEAQAFAQPFAMIAEFDGLATEDGAPVLPAPVASSRTAVQCTACMTLRVDVVAAAPGALQRAWWGG